MNKRNSNSSQRVFDDFNKKLKENLIPLKSTPIFSTRFEDPNDEENAFNQPLPKEKLWKKSLLN